MRFVQTYNAQDYRQTPCRLQFLALGASNGRAVGNSRTMVEDSSKPVQGMSRITAPLLWVYGFSILGLVIQVGGTAVLARILVPQAFGEIAAVSAILRVVQHVANMGLTTALTREAGRIDAASRGLIIFSVSSSLLLAGVVWICAPLLLWFQPEAHDSIAILRVLAFGPALAALGQAAAAMLQASLDFRRLGMAQVVAQVVGQIGVAIPLAYWGGGTWSLVCGSLVQGAVLSVLLLAMARPKWRGPLVPPADLLRLGFRYMLLRLLDVSGQAVPPLAVATFAGLMATGAFDRAFVLSVVPLDMLATGLAVVLFPIYARQPANEETSRFLLNSIALGGGILLAVATGILMARDYLILTVLGEQWHESIPLLGWLAIWGFLRGLGVLNGTMIEARSSLKFRSIQQACYVVGLAGLLVATGPADVEHILMLLVAVEVVNAAAHVWHSSHVANITPSTMLRSLLTMLYPGLAVATALALVAPVIPAWPPGIALCLCMAVAALALFAVLYWHPSASLRGLVRQLLQDLMAAGRSKG